MTKSCPMVGTEKNKKNISKILVSSGADRAPLPTAHCLPHLCVGSGFHRGTSPILYPGTLLFSCYYSASYLLALSCPGGIAGPPNADCYPTAPSLLCGWSDGLEWSPGCGTSDASVPLVGSLSRLMWTRPS